jgi:hypothetical protein
MSSPTNSRLATSALALITLVFALLFARQTMRLSVTSAELQQTRRDLRYAVAQAAHEQLRGRHADLVGAISWLDDFYRAPDGLQRPRGVWSTQADRVDGEAIAVWIFETYLPARVSGMSEEAARQAVVDAIRATDEWQRRHPAASRQ